MKLAFSTLLCNEMNLEEMINLCLTTSLKNIELREDPRGIIHLNSNKIQRSILRKQLSEANIQITNIGTGICASGHNVHDTEKALQQTHEALQLAADIEAPAIRIFLGNFAFHYHDPKPVVHYELIRDYLKEASSAASSLNKEVWIETHNEFSTGLILNRLLNDVGSESCGVIWDLMHPLERNESIENTLACLGSACKHVHIKDGVPNPDPSMCDWHYTPIGEGSVPIANVCKLLENAGYSGYHSLEWESKWRKELQPIADPPDAILKKYVSFMSKIEE